MLITEKFHQKLYCICGNKIFFEIIDNIECDWGIHTVIQCPSCEELFSIDKKCSAFQDILDLLQLNPKLYSDNEKSLYVVHSHPI